MLETNGLRDPVAYATLDPDTGRLDQSQALQVVLASMGSTLDNVNCKSTSPISYSNQAGDYVFDHSEQKIGILELNVNNEWELTAKRTPSESVMYCNANIRNMNVGFIQGQQAYATDLGKPVWFNGTNWVDAAGSIM